MDQNIAKRYSTALFEVALEDGKIDTFQEQLEDIKSVFNENTDLVKVLDRPNIKLNDKKSIIEKIFKDRIDDEMVRLLFVLLKNGKICEFHNICKQYKEIVDQHSGIKIARVTTAVKMTADEIETFKAKLSQKYGCSIEINNIVDTSILGGVFLKVDDEVIDSTIRGNLERMKKELLIQKAR